MIYFEEQHCELKPVLNALLRTYEGIFDHPSTIYEGLLAKYLKITDYDLITMLTLLHRFQVIEYNPPSDKPEIFLIQNRMYADDFRIDVKKFSSYDTPMKNGSEP